MYVVSIKRIKDKKGNELPEEKQEFEYLMLFKNEIKDGNKTTKTQIPCFGAEKHAILFPTVGAARDWFKNNKKLILNIGLSEYDTKTLAIRKRIYKQINAGSLL